MSLFASLNSRRHGHGLDMAPPLEAEPISSDSDSDDDEVTCTAEPPRSTRDGQQSHCDSKALRKRLQTAPARAAKAVKKAKADSAKIPTREPTYAQRLQQRFFTHQYQRGSYRKPSFDPADDNNDVKQAFSRERARCVWSLLVSLKSALMSLLQGRGNIQHLLNVCTADDTSTRLRAQSGRSVVYTIMNTFQTAVVNFREDGEHAAACLFVPTPLLVLNSGKASAIHQGFTSWCVATSSGVGAFWRRAGFDARALSSCQWKTTVLMGDALKANDAAWRCERAKRAKAKDVSSLGIRFRCLNHQLCLTRRPVVLSVDSYWATVVRLAHLFEGHSFRRSLANAFVSMFQKEGQCMRTLHLITASFHIAPR